LNHQRINSFARVQETPSKFRGKKEEKKEKTRQEEEEEEDDDDDEGMQV
jgi:hypothetical protein